jgi:hypothetical protein
MVGWISKHADSPENLRGGEGTGDGQCSRDVRGATGTVGSILI